MDFTQKLMVKTYHYDKITLQEVIELMEKRMEDYEEWKNIKILNGPRNLIFKKVIKELRFRKIKTLQK